MTAADPIRAIRECRFALKAVEYRENMQADGTDGHLSCPECGASPGAHLADCKVSSAIAFAERALAEHEALRCTCGSGGHPRDCAMHPDAKELHCMELDLEAAKDDAATAYRDGWRAGYVAAIRHAAAEAEDVGAVIRQLPIPDPPE